MLRISERTHWRTLDQQDITRTFGVSDGRHTLIDDRKGFHRLDGTTEKRRLSADSLGAASPATLGIIAPEKANLTDLFSRLPKS